VNDPEQNPALSSSIIAEAASAAAASTQVAMASTPAAAAQAAAMPEKSGHNGSAQPAVASNNPPLAPVITAAVARSSMEEAFDTAYAVPQNASYTPARLYQANLENGAKVPVPTARPNVQKRPGAGMAMADQAPGLSQENWSIRTSNWQ